MPKIRKPASIENGLSEVVKILSEDEIEEAIGKSSSYLRKCSDPDNKRFQIEHDESVKLDLKCIEKKKAPPLLNSHEFMISRQAKSSIINEKDKLEGTHKKLLDVSLAKRYGWKYKTSLEKGLALTINDYLEQIVLKKKNF